MHAAAFAAAADEARLREDREVAVHAAGADVYALRERLECAGRAVELEEDVGAALVKGSRTESP